MQNWNLRVINQTEMFLLKELNEIMQRKAAQVFVGQTKKAEMDKNIGSQTNFRVLLLALCCNIWKSIELNCSATARVEVIRLVDLGHLTLVTFKEIEG